jgi:hypothetical protein
MNTVANLARLERVFDGASMMFLLLGMALAAAVFTLGG